jgi:NADP-dependent 3-hydroxy acid dehydrogenase YdfG
MPKTPSFRLDGRRALVTGAGRGIGSAVAAALAQAGAHVTLCARTASEIEQGATALRDLGLAADTMTLDVTDVTGFAGAIDAAEPYHICCQQCRD